MKKMASIIGTVVLAVAVGGGLLYFGLGGLRIAQGPSPTLKTLEVVRDAVEKYRSSHGEYPASLESKDFERHIRGLWPSEFNAGAPTDEWGGRISYRRLNGNRFSLRSPGPDGKLGTADDVEGN